MFLTVLPLFVALPFLSFSLGRDCERRGWYDSPQSALRPHSDVAKCALIPYVCKLVYESVTRWCVPLPLCRMGLVAMFYSAHCLASAASCLKVYTPSVRHAHSYRAAQSLPAHPSKMHSSPGACGAWRGARGVTPISIGSRHSL